MTRSTGSAAVARRAMPRSAGVAQTDWQNIKTDYIEGPETTFRALARLHHVSFTALQMRATREGWVAARTQRHQVVDAAWRRREARELTEARRAAISAAEELLAVARQQNAPVSDLLRASDVARRTTGALWTAASRVASRR